MKTLRLALGFLPATLFLAGFGLRAQEATSPSIPPPQASSSLTPKEQALLKRFDTNGDGKLDDEELAHAHEVLQSEARSQRLANASRLYARLLAKYDTAHTGTLTPAQQDEAVAFLKTSAPGVYTRLVQRFDKDGHGSLDRSETEAMFTALSEATKEAKVTESQAPAAPSGQRDRAGRFLYERLLQTFDTGHTGRLNPAEQAAALAYLKSHSPQVYQHLLATFDKNKDGVIDETESQFLFDSLALLPPVPGAGPKEKS